VWPARRLDLFVLGGEPGQGEDLELPEQGEGGFVRGEAILSRAFSSWSRRT